MKRSDRNSPSFDEIRLWDAYTSASGMQKISFDGSKKANKKSEKETERKNSFAPKRPLRFLPLASEENQFPLSRSDSSFQFDPSEREKKKPSGGVFNPEYEKKLLSGDVAYHAKLDLHGMTLERAFDRLARFIVACRNEKKRILLIITGKGRPDPETGEKIGALRAEVPVWVRSNPKLNCHIREILPASKRHGGDGAYYLLLKK